jgi:hypothetical protein
MNQKCCEILNCNQILTNKNQRFCEHCLKLICDKHTIECPICYYDMCAECEKTKHCEIEGDNFHNNGICNCQKPFKPCVECLSLVCTECQSTNICDKCNCLMCDKCYNKSFRCSHCGINYCSECSKEFAGPKTACQHKVCYYYDCYDKCSKCNENCCSGCLNDCAFCGNKHCGKCIDKVVITACKPCINKNVKFI